MTFNKQSNSCQTAVESRNPKHRRQSTDAAADGDDAQLYIIIINIIITRV